MNPPAHSGATAAPSPTPAQQVFDTLLAAFLALVFLKFGNPVVFDHMVGPPQSIPEFIFQSWPFRWGHWALLVLLAVGLPQLRSLRPSRALWIAAPLAVWFLWQFVAATSSIRPDLSRLTLVHFTAIAGSYLLGFLVVGARPLGSLPRIGLLLALLLSLQVGFDQHFGGLEATRRMVYESTDVSQLPLEYRKRIASTRVFSTFVYPNTFAAGLLLVFPIALASLCQLLKPAQPLTRVFLAAAISAATLAALVWTGSKSGWLLALALLALVLFIKSPLPRRTNIALLAAGLALGLILFFVRFSDYFARGATSVGARFDYWNAAVQTFKNRPWTGVGPGAFGDAYSRIKPPEAEMARLAHNDFLQQASDSGWIACVAYSAFWITLLAWRYRGRPSDPIDFSLLIGVTAFAAHSLVEFNLYIPSLAWIAFLFAGYLHRRGLAPSSTSNQLPTRTAPS